VTHCLSGSVSHRVHARTHTLGVHSPFFTPPHWLPQLCGKKCPVFVSWLVAVSWLFALSVSLGVSRLFALSISLGVSRLFAWSISPSRRSLSTNNYISLYVSHTHFISFLHPPNNFFSFLHPPRLSQTYIYECMCIFQYNGVRECRDQA